MTKEELKRGLELDEKISEIIENIGILAGALHKESGGGLIKRFAFRCVGNNKLKVEGGSISFGGFLMVDRECMELLLHHYQNKLNEAQKEFEHIGKGE